MQFESPFLACNYVIIYQRYYSLPQHWLCLDREMVLKMNKQSSARLKVVIRHLEGSSMSILEKVIQAEKEAEKALILAKSNSEAAIAKAREEVSNKEALAVQALNKQISDLQKKADHQIAEIKAGIEQQKKELTEKITEETLATQKKVTAKLFRDITSL